MKKMLIAICVLLMTLAVAQASNPGAIWTTTGSCGEDPQDANHYAVGEDVYINGAGFDPETYAWDITGLPGGASCDPSSVVASGDVVVGQDGSFCFNAYTVAADDCGEYKADVNGKHDNYRVKSETEVPEFGLAGALVATVSIGLFIISLRRNN